MGKVERAKSRPSDSQEGWKMSEDSGGSKTSWADAMDPRAPSPGNMGQYNKSAQPALQDYQVTLDMCNTSHPLCVQSLFLLLAS